MEGISQKNISDKEKENNTKTTSKKKTSLKIDLNLQDESTEKKVILKKPKEETSYIKILLNKISSYNNSLSNNKNNTKNFITFKCLKEKCPYIPLLKYYEYTQTVSAICRNNHQYHVPLSEYFEKILQNLETKKYCEECHKKNLEENIPEYFCTNCSFFLCKNCQIKHYSKHKTFELSKINTICPIHEKNKFSGFCRACKIDLCIHCLKDHENGKGHHSLVQYMYLIPSKEKIDKYKKQIKDEFDFIEKLKIILFDENGVKDANIKKILDEFFDRMKLKLYFYEIQIQTFEKIKLNINIIKNVTDLFLLRQQTFEGIYTPILLNFSEKKLEIINRILSIVLKYQINDKKINLNLPDDTPKSYLTHFKFNHIYSLGSKKNVKFLYILKNGKFLACSDNDGLYIYDDSTYKELIHIPSEIDIIDLCENDKGLIFLLKKSMIEIIRLEENCMNYITENKILFKYIDQVNFITCLDNGTIIVSRTKRTEGNLDIWMKSKVNDLTDNNNNGGNDNGDNGNNNNNNNNNDNRRNVFFAQDRRRNMFNIVNNNLRLGFMLRTARHNVNNFYQNNFLNLNNLNNVAVNNQIAPVNNIIINPTNNNNIGNNNNVNNNNNVVNNNNNGNNNNDENNNDNNNNNDNDDDDDEDNNDENSSNNNNNNNNNANNNTQNIQNTNANNNNNNIIDNNINNQNNNQNNNNNNANNQMGILSNNNANTTNNNINMNNINNNNINNENINENNNENIIIQEEPEINQNNDMNNLINVINDNNNNINNAPGLNNILLPNLNQINVNNNNIINNNIQNNNNRINNRIHGRNRAPRPRPRFVHVIRFIRDQLQGLVHNLEQEELVLEDPSLISSVGIYGSKDNEITHIIKPVKRGYEINALIDWDNEFFICAEFYIEKKDLRAIKIYSKETYEPIKKKNKLKAKYCMKDKNSLIKINDNLLGVCYTIDEKEDIEYGISLISFRTRDEVSRYELPKFNLAKKISMNNYNYIFVFCKELYDRNDNAIKVLKIQDNELIQSSNYFYEEFLSTYIYNNNSLKDNEDENKEKIDNINLNENNNIFTINNYDQNDIIDEREMNSIISMIKLTNDTFVCLKRDYSINCYKVEQ